MVITFQTIHCCFSSYENNLKVLWFFGGSGRVEGGFVLFFYIGHYLPEGLLPSRLHFKKLIHAPDNSEVGRWAENTQQCYLALQPWGSGASFMHVDIWTTEQLLLVPCCSCQYSLKYPEERETKTAQYLKSAAYGVSSNC